MQRQADRQTDRHKETMAIRETERRETGGKIRISNTATDVHSRHPVNSGHKVLGKVEQSFAREASETQPGAFSVDCRHLLTVAYLGHCLFRGSTLSDSELQRKEADGAR